MDDGVWIAVGLLGLGFFALLAFMTVNRTQTSPVAALGTEALTFERDEEGRLRGIVSTRVKT